MLVNVLARRWIYAQAEAEAEQGGFRTREHDSAIVAVV
jgi:hypothetical protein